MAMICARKGLHGPLWNEQRILAK